MRLRTNILFYFFLLVSQICTSQDCNEIEIQYITLKDSVLNYHLEKYTDTLNQRNELGYVWLRYSNIMSSPEDIGSVFKYVFYREGVGFDNNNDSDFPLFYTLINDRPILISYDSKNYLCYQFTNRSKRKFKKLVEPFLPQPRKLVLSDANGKKHKDKSFRPDSFQSLHGEWVLNYYEDSPPKLRRSTYRD